MRKPLQQIAAVLVHVPVPAGGLVWYARAFPCAIRQRLDDQAFEYLQIGPVRIEIVQADEKVSSGASGSVVYWSVADLDDSLAALEAIGATLYRGPMAIENGQRMCQVRDPWGNCFGLRSVGGAAGPALSASTPSPPDSV